MLCIPAIDVVPFQTIVFNLNNRSTCKLVGCILCSFYSCLIRAHSFVAKPPQLTKLLRKTYRKAAGSARRINLNKLIANINDPLLVCPQFVPMLLYVHPPTPIFAASRPHSRVEISVCLQKTCRDAVSSLASYFLCSAREWNWHIRDTYRDLDWPQSIRANLHVFRTKCGEFLSFRRGWTRGGHRVCSWMMTRRDSPRTTHTQFVNS